MRSHFFKTTIYSIILSISLGLGATSIFAMNSHDLFENGNIEIKPILTQDSASHFSNIAEYLGISFPASEVTRKRKVGICISETNVEYQSPLFEGVSFQWIESSQFCTDMNLKGRSGAPAHGTLVAGTLVGASLSQENPSVGNWGLCRNNVNVHVNFQNGPLSVIKNPEIDIVCFSEHVEEEYTPHLEPLIQAGKIVLIASGNDGWNLDAENNIEFQRLKHLPIIWVGTYDPPSSLCGTSRYLTAEQIMKLDEQNGAIFLTVPHHITLPTSEISFKTLRERWSPKFGQFSSTFKL